jgi:hypothetical protein
LELVVDRRRSDSQGACRVLNWDSIGNRPLNNGMVEFHCKQRGDALESLRQAAAEANCVVFVVNSARVEIVLKKAGIFDSARQRLEEIPATFAQPDELLSVVIYGHDLKVGLGDFWQCFDHLEAERKQPESE